MTGFLEKLWSSSSKKSTRMATGS